MATLYVSGAGSDTTGNGSSGNPWRSLNKAHTQCANGDTIIVRNGTYQEELDITKANTTWRADTGHTPVIDGRYHLGLLSGSGNTITKNMTMPRIDAANYLPGTLSKNGILQLKASGVTVDGFVVQNVAGAGITLGASNTTVKNCVTFCTYDSGIMSNPDGNVSGLLIENNIVRLASMKIFDPARTTGYAGGCKKQCVAGSMKIGNNTGNTIIRGNDIGWGFAEGLNIGKFNTATLASPIIVEGNTIHDINHTYLYINASRGIVVRNNTLYCTNIALNLWDGDSPVGLRILDEVDPGYTRDLQLYNNLVVNLGYGLDWGARDTTTTNVYVGHNTFVGGTQADIKGFAAIFIHQSKAGVAQKGIFENNVIDYSMTNQAPSNLKNTTGANGVTLRNNNWSSQPEAAARGTGDVNGLPRLVWNNRTLVTTNYPTKATTSYALLTASDNFDPDDYRLTGSSPAIEAASNGGAASGVTPPGGLRTDYFGATRAGNAADRDIGAIEFGGVVTNSVTADFTATPRQGNAPLTVVFTDQSTTSGAATITGYAWDFGDGDTSTEASPTHTYTDAGTYDVELVVTATGGLSDTLTRVGYIVVGTVTTASVTAAFTAAPLSGALPLSVTFANLSTAAGGATIDRSSWNFGDGTSSNTVHPVHTYATAGTYTVSLLTEDTALGLSDTETKTGYITVSGGNAVDAVFTQSTAGGEVPLTVTFTPAATTSGAAVIDRYIWNYGVTGVPFTETATGTPVSYTYTTPGVYTPYLAVQDSTLSLSDVAAGAPITVTAGPGDTGAIFDVVRAQLRTTAGSQTLSFNLDGSAPSLVLFIVTKATTIGANTAGVMLSYGAATAGEQWAGALTSTDAAATTDADNYRTTTACIVSLDAGAVTGRAARASFGPNQATLDVTDGFPAGYYVHAVAIGGTSIAAKAAEFLLGANGSTTTLAPGFTPNVYLFGGSPAGAANAVDEHADFVFGWADGTRQYGFHWRDKDAQALALTKASITSDGKVIVNTYNDGEASLNFAAKSLSVSKANINRTFHYAALGLPSGISATVRQFTTPTTTGNVSYDLDMAPAGLLGLFTLLDTLDARKVTAVADGFALVAVDSGATYSAAIAAEGSADTSNTTSRVDNSIVVTDGAGVVKLAGAVTLDADGFDINWTTVQASARYFTVMGISGAATVAGPVAEFIATPTTTIDGVVTFTDLSNANGAAISAWAWDFGDESEDTTQNPTHTYTEPGTYTVTLTVTNANGSSTVTKANYITVEGEETEWLYGPYESGTLNFDTSNAIYGDDPTHPDYGRHYHRLNLPALEIDAYPDEVETPVAVRGKVKIYADLDNDRLAILLPDGTYKYLSFD